MTALDDLLVWCKENGASYSDVLNFKQMGPHNIGVLAQESKASIDEDHIKLPLNLAVTLKDAIAAFDGQNEKRFYDISRSTSNINAVLKLFLARERSSSFLQNSFYKPYISLLPGLVEINTPYTWTPEDKACLKGTNLGNSMKSSMQLLVEEWWQLINLLPEDMAKPTEHYVNMKFYYEFKFYEDKDIYDFLHKTDIDNWTSFANYLWASTILKSRSFPAYLIKDANQTADHLHDEAMLLPLIDLLNHSSQAKVEWAVKEKNEQLCFCFNSNSIEVGQEVFNNYGMKGNEELLLAYGFCIENNPADSAALSLMVPLEMLPNLEAAGVKLPKIEDYTTAVVRTESKPVDEKDKYKQYEKGLLFFITNTHIPDNLVLLFQNLIQSPWENDLTLRMRLAGLNQLRNALEAKINIINNIPSPDQSSPNAKSINIYVSSQKLIFNSAIKMVKRMEKLILTDPELKKNLITLKSVFKKDKKFADSLLIALGITSYDQVLEHNFQDQAWLLYLIRCHNMKVYEDEEELENYLPEWIYESFERIVKENEITAAEILQFKEIYEGLIIPLTQAAPDVFNRGVWTVEELIWSSKLLDTISFTRGKEQECILVKP